MRPTPDVTPTNIDPDLIALIDAHNFAESETVPVFVRISEGDYDPVARAIEMHGGRERMRLERVNALSAWVPLAAIRAIAGLKGVAMVSMVDDIVVA